MYTEHANFWIDEKVGSKTFMFWGAVCLEGYSGDVTYEACVTSGNIELGGCRSNTCTHPPSGNGYNTISAGGNITGDNFAPSGVVCAGGHVGMVVYTVCEADDVDYILSGCEAIWDGLCGAGTYTPWIELQGNATCLPCPPGKYSYEIAIVCTECSEGQYSSRYQSMYCENCGRGLFLNVTGSNEYSDCISCDAGQYSALMKADQCTECAVGKYVEAQGMPHCIDCFQGKYTDQKGSDEHTDCLDCPSGRYVIATGSDDLDDCIRCNAGFYLAATGSDNPSDCISCHEGQYVREIGSAECTPCAAGKHSIDQGSHQESSCISCGAGTFAPPGSTYCDICPIGRYAQTQDSAECILCDAGSYTATYRMETFGRRRRRATTFVSSYGSNNCVACDMGKFTPANDDCISCHKGKYSDTLGSTECTDCPTGRYNRFQGSDSESFCAREC